jgi:hypothetical protein
MNRYQLSVDLYLRRPPWRENQIAHAFGRAQHGGQKRLGCPGAGAVGQFQRQRYRSHSWCGHTCIWLLTNRKGGGLGRCGHPTKFSLDALGILLRTSWSWTFVIASVGDSPVTGRCGPVLQVLRAAACGKRRMGKKKGGRSRPSFLRPITLFCWPSSCRSSSARWLRYSLACPWPAARTDQSVEARGTY